MKLELTELEKIEETKNYCPAIIESEILKIEENSAKVEYQSIEYCMCNRGRCVSYHEHLEIDFQKALSEMMGLDWTYLKNGISFINNKTDESLFFTRLKQNFWYAETGPRVNGKWVGYFLAARVDNESAMTALRLFFEEGAWMGSLHWTKSSGLFEELKV